MSLPTLTSRSFQGRELFREGEGMTAGFSSRFSDSVKPSTDERWERGHHQIIEK